MQGSSITGRSVTGGYIYRGTKTAYLRGSYIFADYSSRLVFILRPTEGAGDRQWEASVLTETAYAIGSFAQDPTTGEVYVLPYATSRAPILALSPREDANELFVAGSDFGFNPDIDEDFDKHIKDSANVADIEDDGLSTGAIVGITIGALIILVLLIAAIIVVRRRQANNATKPAFTNGNTKTTTYKLENVVEPPKDLTEDSITETKGDSVV